MKKAIALILAGLVLAGALAGCSKKNDTESSDKQKEAELIQSAREEGNMHPDANITTGRDTQGNVTFEYENPDGQGGGGGMVID